MLKITNNKSSRHLFLAYSFVYLAAIAIATVVCLFVYILQFNEHKDYSTQRESQKASKALSESFDNISVYLKFVAKSIITNSEAGDNDAIAKILQEKLPDDIGDKEIFAFTVFDWIGPERNYVANSVYGIFPRQSNLQHRTYLDKTDKTPWKVFHSPPVVGVPSGQKVIPVGMGVTDETGNFYGTIATGIRISKLEEKLSQILYHDLRSYSFILLSEDFKPVLASIDFYKSTIEEDFLTQLPRKLDEEMGLSNMSHGFLQKKMHGGRGIKYVFFSKIENYPYYLLMGENQSQIKQEIIFGFIPYFIIILFTTAICFAIFYRYHIRMVEPLANISNELSDSGMLKAPHDKLFSELKHLVAFIKKKLEELKTRKQELSHLSAMNNSLQQRLNSESEEITLNLREKMDFIKTVSHEVRSPVQGVAAITKGLVEHWSDLADSKKYSLVKEVFKNSNKLFNLVNNLLDNTKLESGKMSYHFERTNLKDLIEEIIDEFCLHLEEKQHVKIVKDINEKIDYYCVADAIKVGQVLRNIIANAIKFTNNGAITIALSKITEHSRNFIKVAVQDEGIGVPDDEKQHIFDSFFQSSRSKNVAIGTGLGLSISKDIVTAHDGTIWVEDNKNNGSVFYFTIPEVIAPKQASSHHKQIKNILLIDDDETSSSSLSLMLYEFNFNITSLQTGHDAMGFLNKNKNKVDLMFLDMILPDMDGLEILQFMKKDRELEKIPVILQSGVSGKDELMAALELGAFATLVKPFDKKALLKILDLLRDK